MLFRFGKPPSPLCSFCKLHDKALIHLLFSEYIQLTLLSPQIATFGLVKVMINPF